MTTKSECSPTLLRSGLEKVGVPVLRHMEALQEEVSIHQQDHQGVPVGFQQEVPVRPEERPGQGPDDEDDTKMDIYFVIFSNL